LMSCHQRPERSFFVRRRQFHVCARCTGLLAGLTLAPFALTMHAAVLFLFPTALAILIADGLSQRFRLRDSSNLLRLSTGITTSATGLGALLYLFMRI